MAISPSSIAPMIEAFIKKERQVPDNDPRFTRDANLFDLGFVDSMGFIQLLAFIESTFHMTFDVDRLFSPDFTTINGITKLIQSRLKERQPATDL